MTTKLRYPRLGSLFLLLACWFCSAATTTAQGPIAYYPFNGSAADASGNGHNGTVNGATLTRDRFGKPDNAYFFDGDDYIEVPHAPQLAFGGGQSFTINAWVNFCQTQPTFAGIVVKGPRSTNHPGYQLFISNPSRPAFEISNSNATWTRQVTTVATNDGRWHLLTVMVSPTAGTIALYVDAVLNATANSPIIMPEYADQSRSLHIGVERNGTVFFTGSIDDVSLYNRILTAQELTQLYRQGNWTGPDSARIRTVSACSGGSTILESPGLLGPYTWSTGATTPTIEVNRTGTYWVRGTSIEGCPVTDTFKVSLRAAPIPVTTALVVCGPGSVSLEPKDLEAPYLWSTGGTTRSIQVSSAGKYWVTGTQSDGCPRTDTFDVTTGTSPPPTVTAVRACPGDAIILESRDLRPPYRWSTGATSKSIQVVDGGTYWLQGSVGLVCPRTDTFHVTLGTVTPIDAGPKRTICLGDTIELQATGSVGYRWDPNPSLSCTTCSNPRVFPSVTTSYIVTSVDTSGCPGRDTVQVIVYSAVKPDAGPDRTICRGDTLQLRAEGSTGTYRWEADSSLSCLECANPRVAPLTSTRYVVTVTTPNGCQAQDTISVTVADLPTASAGRDTAICAGAAFQLSGSGGGRYQWTPASGLSCIDCASPIAAPLESTRYTLTVWNAAGCWSRDEVQVDVIPLPVIDAPADMKICRGETVKLEVAGGVRYTWRAHPDLSCLDCPDPQVRPSVRTTYHVTGMNANGCEGEDSVTIDLLEPPSLRLSGDSVICPASEARVSADNAVRYTWSSPSLQLACPECREQTLTPMETTMLYVSGTSAEGCTAIDSFRVEVIDRPEISIDGGGEICPGASMRLHARGGVKYQWEPTEGLSCSDCPDPVATPSVTTLYRVIGTGATGCIDTSNVTVVVIGVPETVITRLPRNTHLTVGEPRRIALTLDQDLIADTLVFDLQWRRGVLRLKGVQMSAALRMNGWQEQVLGHGDDFYRSVFVRTLPDLIPAGDLIELTVVGYIGDSTHVELPFTLRANTTCAIIEPRPGNVIVDSICGLESRLITVSAARLRLDVPVPNPLAGSGVIHYELPFDAHDVTLTLVDAAGNVTILREGYHAEGKHEVVIDSSHYAPGTYGLVLRVGDLVRQIRLVLVQ